jgi:hypothetical protein
VTVPDEQVLPVENVMPPCGKQQDRCQQGAHQHEREQNGQGEQSGLGEAAG